MVDKKTTLYLNMILGDFEDIETVKRSIDSVKDQVDGMYITITYKGDKPKQNKLAGVVNAYIAQHGGKVSFFKWTYNFAEARQYALDQVPRGENIFVYWQDADDVLQGSEHLHRIADEMIPNQESAVYFNYLYQVDLNEEGDIREILVEHKRERIIRNDDTWKWVGALHETLIEQKVENVIRHLRRECQVVHLTNNQRLDHNIKRNIEILETTARKEQHKDPRTVIYLAKAYYDSAKMTEDLKQRKIYLDLALNLFHEYLAGAGAPGTEGYQPSSGWPEERSTAWSYVAEIAVLTGHPDIAIGAYQSAIDEAPMFPEYYIDMAMCYVMREEFKKAEHWLNVATNMPEPETTIIQFPRERKTRALEASFHINIHKNKLEWALEDAEKLLAILPNDKLAQDRVQHAASLVAYNKACQSIMFVSKYLEQIKETDKIPSLLQAIPSDMHHEQFIAQMKHLFNPPTIHGDKEITIVCGPGFENWDANSVKTGLGGSEEAVVYMAQELTKLGWHVTVYANPARPGNFDGVEYKVWHDLNPKDEFNVLILWRAIGFADVKPKSKFTLLWLHDVPNNPDFTEERLACIDKIAVLSEYHKSLLRVHKNGLFRKMPENKVFVTANGITPLSMEWKGNPHRMIYASSFDRGVVYLLRNWPIIRKEVPDAELHLFYGWELYDKIHRGNPERAEWKNKVVQMMQQDGIVYHGRVGHRALHHEFAKSGIWAYPTDFTEISCITAMKAQALGAIPVVTNMAALEETVRNGVKVDVDIETEEGQEEYIGALIALLKDEKQQESIRPEMMKWARKQYAWENVAKLWDERFRVGMQSLEKRYESKTETTTNITESSNEPGGAVQAVPGGAAGIEQGQSLTSAIESNGGARASQENSTG